jgi:hypothetical protein
MIKYRSHLIREILLTKNYETIIVGPAVVFVVSVTAAFTNRDRLKFPFSQNSLLEGLKSAVFFVCAHSTVNQDNFATSNICKLQPLAKFANIFCTRKYPVLQYCILLLLHVCTMYGQVILSSAVFVEGVGVVYYRLGSIAKVFGCQEK